MGISISIIMVDGGFRENIWTVHSWMNQLLKNVKYEIIWVDYTNKVPKELCKYSNFHYVCLGLKDYPQKLSYCYNEGIRCAKGDIIVFPDADVVCEDNLLNIIYEDISQDPELVLYILRLDQLECYRSNSLDIDTLKNTCFIKHTYNYGGCTAIHKKWLVKMNGYEQLPFFSGYHYNGGDNYIRYKNMGLKIKWHNTARVYHPWHPLPKNELFDNCMKQENFIKWRSASWDYMAFDGIDSSKNRAYTEDISFKKWPSIITERGIYYNNSYSENNNIAIYRKIINAIKRRL